MCCAKLPQNISKNRYRDISPCKYLFSLCVKFNLLNITLLKYSFFYIFSDDATRVILKGNEDYINANYINVSCFFLIIPLSFGIRGANLNFEVYSRIRD